MKNKILKQVYGLSAFLVLMGSVSCSPMTQPPTPTTTALPATAVPPTAVPTPAVPGRILTLTFTTNVETGQTPVYTLTTETPVLLGSGDPAAAGFNQTAAALVQKLHDGFITQDLKGVSTPSAGMGSSFDVHSSLVSTAGDLLSLKMVADEYVDGAAHPFQFTVTLNYDLAAGRELSLGDLFLLGATYLDTLAAYCKTQLAGRDIDFEAFASGADPTPDNYHNWNITSDGLLITFDEYQVAPYAAGPQTVTVPYSELKGSLDPHGLLAAFIP